MPSSTTDRIPLDIAEGIAGEIVERFRPVCDRIEIAGSIRRRRPDVGDIEIVLVPKLEPTGCDLFGNPIGFANHQRMLVDQLVREGMMADRLDVNGHPARGERLQRMTWKGFPLDIFAVLPPADWGVIATIRTGPASFSKFLVTKACDGGQALRMGQEVRDGQLWDRGVVVPCPEERDFFASVGVPWVKPEDRR